MGCCRWIFTRFSLDSKLHCITLDCITLYYITLYYILLHLLHYIYYMVLHYIYYIVLHYIILHCIRLSSKTRGLLSLNFYTIFLRLKIKMVVVSKTTFLPCCCQLSHSSMKYYPVSIIITASLYHHVCRLPRNAKNGLLASSPLSVRLEQLGSHWTDFHEICYLSISKICREN